MPHMPVCMRAGEGLENANVDYGEPGSRTGGGAAVVGCGVGGPATGMALRGGLGAGDEVQEGGFGAAAEADWGVGGGA